MLRLPVLLLSMLAADALLAPRGTEASPSLLRLPASLDAEALGPMPVAAAQSLRRRAATLASAAAALGATALFRSPALAEEARPDFGAFRVPFNHENLPLSEFLGTRATLVANLKLDDPQTVSQFPALREIFDKYADAGLNVLIFPTEQVHTAGQFSVTAVILRLLQGYFEPDDDETVRAKAKEYFGFGRYPRAVVFDKVDLLGPSAHPLFVALTTELPTPNGYGRITLNYEKFLLDGKGRPLRRYPRKFSAYDFESDISAVVKGDPLPEESPAFQKVRRSISLIICQRD